MHQGFSAELNQATRVIDVPGLANIRDVGGLPSALGLMRRGLLYRADNLAKATEEGKVVLMDQLKVRTVFDLRHASECEDQGVMELSGVVRVAVPLKTTPLSQTQRAPQGAHAPGTADVNREGSGLANFAASMGEGYVGMLLNYRESFKRILQSILTEGETPAVFHCTGGKDRTGKLL
jgi:protein-tyrosine phosphatase